MYKEDLRANEFWGVSVDGCVKAVSSDRRALFAFRDSVNIGCPNAARIVRLRAVLVDESGRDVRREN